MRTPHFELGLSDQRGGAMVEFAVATLVMVPLVLYGIWFSDALHFATVAEEATIEPAFDATAYLGHDYTRSGASASSIYSRIAQAVQQQVQGELASSYNSYDSSATPVQASVLVRPKSLQLTCQPSNGNGNAPRNSYGKSATDLDATLGKGSGYLQTKTWITCSAAVNLDSHLMPHEFRQDAAHVALFPSSRDTLQICGVGPGLWGCPRGQGDGFSILLDDWAVELGSANRLSIGSAGGNKAYFNVGQTYYSGLSSAPILAAMGAVTNIPEDLGSTPNYRLTYEVDGNGSYAQTESSHGQSNPLGGPSNPHTGGPWHDEHSSHQQASEKSFQTRTNKHYLARSDYPAD